MLKGAASVTLLFSLVACSSPPKPGTPEYALQQHEFQVEKTKTAADQAPDWYVNPPKSDGYIYAAGTATSSDLQFAVDKAILNAKYQLADQMNGKVSGQQKAFITEDAAGQTSGTAERATNNLVANIALPAYQVTQRKVIPLDTQFRSYVLLQFAVPQMPQQTASALPPPSPAQLQTQAETAQQDLQKAIAGGVPPAGSAPEPPAPAAAPRPAVDAGGDTL